MTMTEYLLEIYLSRADAAWVERSVERTRLAAEELTREGTPVRHVLAVFIPQDETCLLLYQAASAEAVQEAARRAALRVDRIVEVCTGSA
jgi:hypothetical protein